MKPTLSRRIALALLAMSGAALAADIDVMTQNQYLGADLTPVLDAATAQPFDPAAFNTELVATLGRIAATRPAERVRALADQILQRRHDVVAIQEAYAFGCQAWPGVPQQAGQGCLDPTVRAAFTDHLADTQAALRGRYYLAGRVTEMNIPAIPFMVNGVPALLSVTDRDAIFVRHGVPAKAVDFSATGHCAKPSDQGCNYQTAPPPQVTPAVTIALERGFLAADVRLHGQTWRVFNTHFEQRLLAPSLPETRLLQVGQAYELLGAVLGSWDGVKKVLVLGDFNSAPGDTIPVPPYPATLPWAPKLTVVPPYQVFAGAGFTDVWTLRHPAAPGLTCCQDEDLLNRHSALHERIDMIFSLSLPSCVEDLRLLGNTPGDKTRRPGHGGLWPSDHAAVAARLLFH